MNQDAVHSSRLHHAGVTGDVSRAGARRISKSTTRYCAATAARFRAEPDYALFCMAKVSCACSLRAEVSGLLS